MAKAMISLSSIVAKKHVTSLSTPFLVTPQLNLLLNHLKKVGGLGILVGGCVRDHLLGIGATDIDIEVYGVEKNDLEDLLSRNFSVVAVGKTFGIYKVTVQAESEKQTFDVALPRTENKEGQGHKGFVVSTDPFMNFVQASSRRDFTINSMGIDTESQSLLDPHGGKEDLKNRLLKHVSDAFSEDPLRVLRAAQFCARFDCVLAKTTAKLCESLETELFTLSQERIFVEMKKLLLAQKPSLGLKVLHQTNALNLFSELKNCINCPQDAEWHPEGDVWVHTLMVADEAAQLIAPLSLSEDERLIVMAGALCHDLGKPLTTIPKDGRIKSPGHEQAGEEPTRSFLNKMGMPPKLHDGIVALVREHLKPHQLYRARDEITDSAIRRLVSRVSIEPLLLVSQADFLGRTTPDALAGVDPSAAWLQQKVLDVVGPDKSIKPILLGRHLMALGEKPGQHFGEILREAFDAQLDGVFGDEDSALAWLKKRLKH